MGDDGATYDWRKRGDRRKNSRRVPQNRRGVLRWDPGKKERRSGKDRRRSMPDDDPKLELFRV